MNGVDLSAATHQAAVDALKTAIDVCVIKVQRRVIPISPQSISPLPETTAISDAGGAGVIPIETCQIKEPVESGIPAQPARVTIKDFPDEEDVEVVPSVEIT